MHFLFPFFGLLSASRAITTSAPEPDILGDLCTALTLATSIMDSALSMNDKASLDPEIDQRRIAAVNALVKISSKFAVGLERGTNLSRSGFVVATDYIYNIEEYIAGELEPHDVTEMVGPLVRRVDKLLENAKEMHTFFGDIQTDLDKVEYDLNNDDAYISNRISTAQDAIEKARNSRDTEVAFAIVCAALTPIIPVAAPLAVGLAGLALQDDAFLDYSIYIRDNLRNSLNDVRYLKTVVGSAKLATAVQIQYWSQTLDGLVALETTSLDWLEDPTSKRMAKKSLVQWRVVSKKYSECSHLVSDAGRYIQGRLLLLDGISS
ncbi:hypothetical protein BDZ94DRAFT_1308866 [Collybia nuda]|uniref:Uncharacterized protein n=1 Tax=Collybia nuda TaxID=64659 RepID=A0A9P5Y6Z3_9AGAR|nr:hypothetical protein BDZ94DRAFT_1308866 [Collybia nuda]